MQVQKNKAKVCIRQIAETVKYERLVLNQLPTVTVQEKQKQSNMKVSTKPAACSNSTRKAETVKYERLVLNQLPTVTVQELGILAYIRITSADNRAVF